MVITTVTVPANTSTAVYTPSNTTPYPRVVRIVPGLTSGGSNTSCTMNDGTGAATLTSTPIPGVSRPPNGNDDATKGYLPGGVLIPIIPLNGNGGSNYITAPTVTAQGTCAIPWSMSLYVPSELLSTPVPGPFAVQSYTPGAQCTSGVNPYNNNNGTTVSTASFVASANNSSTSLTVSSLITGTITVPSTVTGSGLSSNTSVLSEISGTAGGAYAGSLFVVTSYTASPTPTNPYTNSNTLTSVGSLTITTTSQPMLSNGCPDPSIVDNFCGSSSVQGCKVTTLFDQISTGSINKTQTVLANAPDWSLVNHVGQVRPITFGSMLYTTGTGTAGQTQNGEWLQDSTEVFNPFQGTYLFAGQESLSNTGGIGLMSSLDGSLSLGFSEITSANGPGMGIVSGGLSYPSTLLVDNRPSVDGFVLVSNNNTASLIFSNDMATAFGSTAGASKTGEVLGEITSGSAGPNLAYYDLLAYVENTSAQLTPSQLTSSRAALHEQFQIIPQCDEILIIAGDSTETRGNIWDTPYPRLELDKLRRIGCVFNMAVSGQTIATLSGQQGGSNIQSWLPALCYQANCSSAKNVVLQLKEYPNDIRQGNTVAQIYSDIQIVDAYFKSVVPKGKIILGTAMTQGSISSGTITYQTESMQVVDAIRANYHTPVNSPAVNTDGNIFTGGLGADCLADFASDPIFGPGSSYTSTYLTIGVNSPDHEHLYNNAENYPADIDAACYNSLLPAISTYNP
ncbi:unnamed protein product [Sphagnum tenellum]